MPYACAIMPKNGQRINTRKMPPKNETIPLIRSGLEKKRRVRENPMVMVKPARNRISPSASIAESKKNITPRHKKTHPKNRRPVPIFVLSLNMVPVQLQQRVNKYECLRQITRAHDVGFFSSEIATGLSVSQFFFQAAVCLSRGQRVQRC
jgi:hypothetical protein